MRSYDQALEDIYRKAEEKQILNKKRKKRYVKIAVSCASLCFVLIVSLVIASVIGSQGSHTNENGKVKISTIPNSRIIKGSDYFLAESPTKTDAYTKDEYINVLKRSDVVLGKAKNINSVYVRDGDFTWYITTFDIDVTEAINGEYESDVLSCVTTCKYYGETLATKCGMTDVGMEVVSNPQGLFVVESVESDSWWINDVKYNISDFADYYVIIKDECIGDGIVFGSSELVEINDIRN